MRAVITRSVSIVALGAALSSTGDADAAPLHRAPHYSIPDLRSFATADVDQDGDEDVIAVRGPAVFEVWSNDGGGGLARTQSVALGGLPFDVVAADLNQDGRFDAVVSFQTSVQLLIHQPTGYVAGVPLPVGGDTAGRLAAADLDQDGDVDVVVGTKNSGGAGFHVLAGDGAGGFATAVPHWSGWGGGTGVVEIADLDSDGKLDVTWLDFSHRFHWSFGNGFTFHAWHDPKPGVATLSLDVGDVDADGRNDAVVAEQTSINGTYLRTYVSTAPSGFVPVGPSFSPESTAGVQLAELTGDGKLDAVAGSCALEGSGTGAFEVRAFIPNFAPRIALVDMNGDTRLDLVGASTGVLSLGLSDDSGIASRFGGTVFRLVETMPATTRAMIAFDIDGDQDDDLVTTLGKSIRVLFSDSGGAFTHGPTSTASVDAHQMLNGDFDGDGIQDLVVARDKNELGLCLGDGLGGFSSPTTFFSLVGANRKMLSIAAADVDGDQNLDVLAHSIDNSAITPVASSVRIFRGDGAGGFQLANRVDAGYSILGRDALAARDVNGDSLSDLLLGNVPETAPFQGLGGLQGRLTVWPGTGGFGLGLPVHFPAGPDPASITFADFDQDSQMDVAFGNALGGHLTVPVNATVLFGTGGGSFGPPVKVGEEGGAHRMAGGDFDGDGLIDLACIEHGIWPDGGVLFRSDGTGSFERIGYAAPQPNLVLAADFEGDGRLDLVSHGIGHGIFVVDSRPPAPTSCAGTTTNYGAGCAAASGFFPTLSAYGCPTAGNTVELELLGAPSPAVNFFLLSVATTNLPMGYGCNLLVAPPFVAAPVAKTAGLYAATVAHLPIPLGTPPVTVHVQAFVTNILVEVGFANTNGVTLTVP